RMTRATRFRHRDHANDGEEPASLHTSTIRHPRRQPRTTFRTRNSTHVAVSSLGTATLIVAGCCMKRFEWYGLGLGLLLVWILGGSQEVCQETSLRYGLGLPTCPDGRIRQTAHVEVAGLRRGAPGTIAIGAVANYTTRDADAVQTAEVPKLTSVELALVDAKH